MMMRRLTAAAALVLAVGTLASCGNGDSGGSNGSSGSSGAAGSELSLVKAGTLTVCSDVPYAPFEDFDSSAPTGFKGFDVDIVTAISKALDLKLAIKDSDFAALQSGLLLNSGQCDLGASAMTITPEREKRIAFSDPYYDSKQSLLVPADSSIASIDDLAGKKVGVQRGTTGATYAEQNAKDADLITFKSDGEMYQAIKAGQVDALLQDLPVNLNHENDPKAPDQFKVVQTYDTNESYGLAMKKDNTSLVDAVNAQLKKLRDDGEYQTIYDKYFKVS